MIRIGILGDIGSGKSYVAKNFGYPVFNADYEVSKLYQKNRTVYKKFNEIGNEFLEFIKDKRLIIHNAEFDLAHINHELKLFGKDKLNNEIIDTLILARDKFPGSPVSLDALCKRYRVDNSKRIQHTALIDCDLLAKVYINLIDQKEPTLDFQSNSKEMKQTNNSKVFYFKGVIKPTAEELKNHKAYLKQHLKKNYFN